MGDRMREDHRTKAERDLFRLMDVVAAVCMLILWPVLVWMKLTGEVRDWVGWWAVAMGPFVLLLLSVLTRVAVRRRWLPDFRCPKCGDEIPKRERGRFNAWLLFRRPASCPGCGASLIIASRRLPCVGVGFFAAMVVVGHRTGHHVAAVVTGTWPEHAPHSLNWPALLAIAVTCAGLFRLRLRPVDAKE